jgi:outer membrane protein TolC
LGLTLEESIALSLARNERARAADEATRAAGARVARARSFLLPDLTLLGDYTRRSHETRRTVDGSTSILQSRNGLAGRATLDQTIFDAQAWPLLSQARRAHEAAGQQGRDVKRKLAYETAATFLTALGNEQVERAAAERLDLAERNLEEIRVRFDAQLVGSNDVTRAELEVASAERELVRAHGTALTGKLNLGYLLDAGIEDSLAVRTDGVVDVLVRDPGAQAADLCGRLLGEGTVHVQVVHVDRRRDRDLVDPELPSVVQARPRVLGEELGGRPVRLERAVVVEHPREDVLGGEADSVPDLVGEEALG